MATTTSARVRALVVMGLAATAVCTVATFAIALSNGGMWDVTPVSPLNVTFALIGAAIAWRRPGNLIGWLFIATGSLSSVGLLGKVLATAAVNSGVGTTGLVTWAAWLSVIYVELVSLPIVLVFLLFPDGRPLSRRWRWVAVAVVVNSSLGALMVAISNLNFSDPTVLKGTDQLNYPGLQHPLPLVDPHRLEASYVLYQNVEIALMLLAVASLVVRYRRSAGVERPQVRWVMFAAAVAVSGFVLCLALAPDLTVVAFGILFSLIPIACGIAILRYRLYDIDRIISRTTSYVLVTGLLLASFALVVTSVTRVLPPGSSSAAVAAATLAAAALFRPLLRRVQRVVDRRFDRASYDASRTVEVFGRWLRDQVDPDATSAELLDVVRRTMAPTSTALHLTTREG
jgi:hypothetical protein